MEQEQRTEPVVEPAQVVRLVELDADVDEVWAAVCQPDRWLADEGELDVREGGEGRLVDAGVARRAVVETVVVGERLVYRWWDEDGDGGDASRVEISLVPAGGGVDAPTRLVVRETHLGARLPIATNSILGGSARHARWSCRLVHLGLSVDLARAGVAIRR